MHSILLKTLYQAYLDSFCDFKTVPILLCNANSHFFSVHGQSGYAIFIPWLIVSYSICSDFGAAVVVCRLWNYFALFHDNF